MISNRRGRSYNVNGNLALTLSTKETVLVPQPGNDENFNAQSTRQLSIELC